MIGTLVLLAVLPWINVENVSRIMIAVCAVILGFVWWNSSFERRPGPPSGTPERPVDRTEAIGRSAGRAVGGIARIVRDRTRD